MSRRYPDVPRVGVGAVVLRDGAVLVVRRREPPLAGCWSLPGGLVELGETLEAAVVREVEEETGVRVVPQKPVAVFDHIEVDPDGRVLYHYVLANYLCRYLSGALNAGSDATEAEWAPVGSLSEKDLPPRALELVHSAGA